MLNVKEKELKAAYISEVVAESWNGKDSWREYYEKEIARVVELSTGDLIAIKKPRIETRFCYGYGTFESDEGARRMAARTRTDGGEIFKSENLHDFDRLTECLKDERFISYVRTAYINAPENTKIKQIEYCSGYDWEQRKHDIKDAYILNEGDKALICAAYEIERKEFEKRLDAYLKRYGTTKLKTWTYWQDE